VLLNFAVLHGITWLWDDTKPSIEPERVTYLDLQTEEEEEELKPEETAPLELPKPKDRAPEPPKPVELEELPEPEPEPEPKEEPQPEPEPVEAPKVMVEPVLEQLKMVEQPDDVDDAEAPDDANYLSNVNRNVTEETRARVTNLENDAVETSARQIEPSKATSPGTGNEEVIAQDEEQKSRLNREAPKTTPQLNEQRPAQNDPNPQSMLAMRELERREHRAAQDAREAMAEASDDGTLQAEQKAQTSITAREQRARIDKQDPRYAFKLKEDDLRALFGKDLDAVARAESKAQTKTPGVWSEQRARFQSPLENMVPEVQVGNQTALRSRKHPFARYIAQMHRKIHEAWAWGFLEQLDTRGRQHPLNDYDLWSRVEIVLNGDGSIDKVITVRHSGTSSFDSAAREVIWSAGPYPNPPSEIISGNGKIYIHWAFHRDNKACGTFGAQPFILDNAGNGDRPDPNIRVEPARGGETLSRRLTPPKPTAPMIPEGPALPASQGSQASEEPEHDHSHSHAPAEEGGESEPTAPSAQVDPKTLVAEPEAKRTANEWLHYLATADVARVVSRSSLPFYSGEVAIARTREELHDVLSTMVDELKGQRPKAVNVYTASGLRKAFGSVPAGIQEGQARVYGLTRVGTEYLVVLLEKRFGSWRVVGIAR